MCSKDGSALRGILAAGDGVSLLFRLPLEMLQGGKSYSGFSFESTSLGQALAASCRVAGPPAQLRAGVSLDWKMPIPVLVLKGEVFLFTCCSRSQHGFREGSQKPSLFSFHRTVTVSL